MLENPKYPRGTVGFSDVARVSDVARAIDRPASTPVVRRPDDAVPETTVERLIRRLLDITVSGAALLAAAPLMLVIAVLIKLDSPGPVLFRQIRMSRDRRRGVGDARPANVAGDRNRRGADICGQPFLFVKFRTMHADARARFPDLYRYEYSAEEIKTMKFKQEEDPRLTRFGRWLRRTSLDELPNFWNVLRGDMTLVGPRPEIPEMSQYYTLAQRTKFAVRPGITGPAQVSGRGLLQFQATIEYDVEYVRTRSLRGDMLLIWRTVLAVLFQKGAF
jgi:lipopolysaccharide/colanic/teichoic acid biosynthesis glycosyltransferase